MINDRFKLPKNTCFVNCLDEEVTEIDEIVEMFETFFFLCGLQLTVNYYVLLVYLLSAKIINIVYEWLVN